MLCLRRERSKRADSACVYPALTWLHDMQEVTLLDTGVQLEHQGEFSLGMIEGMVRLCLLCPGCRRPTTVISAWICCGHCDELLPMLTASEQEPLNYSVDLRSGLCTEQPWRSLKFGAGLGATAKGRVESEAGDSPAKTSDIGKESWKSALACSTVRELVPINTAQQELDAVLEMPAAPIHSANPPRRSQCRRVTRPQVSQRGVAVLGP